MPATDVTSSDGATARMAGLALAVAGWWRNASPQARQNVAVTDPGLAGLLTEVAEQADHLEGTLR